MHRKYKFKLKQVWKGDKGRWLDIFIIRALETERKKKIKLAYQVFSFFVLTPVSLKETHHTKRKNQTNSTHIQN